ncbi:MAG: hypothetical protein ABLQ96_11010, partial [Candidatus Acidiferrum sp.]
MKNSRISSLFHPFRFGILAALLAATFLLLHAAGCKTDEKKPSSTEPVRNSTIAVRNDPYGIHLQSSAAEFVLTPSGYLKSSLKV